MTRKNPCYKCEERHTHCHADCEKYKTFHEGMKKVYATRKTQQEFGNFKSDSRTKHERAIRNHNSF